MNLGSSRTTDSSLDWAGPLDSGETVLWQGRPAAGFRVSKKNLFQSAFGIVWVGVPLTSFVNRLSPNVASKGSPFFDLFLLPFIFIGFYMIVGQYFYAVFCRRRTRYSLTEKRAIITTFNKKFTVMSWPITKETKIEFANGKESNIHFAKVLKQDGDGGSFFETIGFEYIKDGETVYKLIRKIQGFQT